LGHLQIPSKWLEKNFSQWHWYCKKLLNKSLDGRLKAANCGRNRGQKSHGTDSGNRVPVSSSKEKKDADSGERGAQRQKRSKEKLIRLDDLIPDEKVVGGRQLFGAADTTQNQKHN
jgi:hypothetical protein